MLLIKDMSLISSSYSFSFLSRLSIRLLFLYSYLAYFLLFIVFFLAGVAKLDLDRDSIVSISISLSLLEVYSSLLVLIIYSANNSFPLPLARLLAGLAGGVVSAIAVKRGWIRLVRAL